MEKKMTEQEKKELMELLEDEFSYELGECEVFDNSAHIEISGKAYGDGSSGYAKYTIENGELVIEDGEGDSVDYTADKVYRKCLKYYPKIKNFSIFAEFD